MYESERNFLERLADRLPGLAGYRDREHSRDTDKRLREHLARRLDRAAAALDPIRQVLTGDGRLEPLEPIGRLDRRVRRAADALRHARYGYAGAFDPVRWRPQELERLYRFDLALLDEVERLEAAMGALGPDGTGAEAAAEAAAMLLERLAARQEIFEAPGGAGGG